MSLHDLASETGTPGLQLETSTQDMSNELLTKLLIKLPMLVF